MSNTQAAKVMTKRLVTIQYLSPLEAAYERMQEKKIRHLPVTDEQGAIIGILSDRDLNRAMKVKVSALDSEITFDPKDLVKDFMSFPVLQVRNDVDVEEVVDRMLKEKVSAFLVSDGRAPVGIITTDDLLKLLSKLLKESGGGRPKLSLDQLFFSESYSS